MTDLGFRAEQFPPSPLTLYPNGWILYFIGSICGDSRADAPPDAEQHKLYQQMRQITELLSALPERMALTAMNTTRSFVESLTL